MAERTPTTAAQPAPDELTGLAEVLRAAIVTHRRFVETSADAHDAYLAHAAALLGLRSVARAGTPGVAARRQPARATSVVDGRVRSGRFVVRARRAPASGFAVPGLLRPGTRVVVTPDGGGVAEALARLLEQHGVDATVRAEVPSDAGVVLHLAGLRQAPTLDSALEINLEAFRVVRSAGRGLSERGGALVLVQDTGGDFGLAGSARAGSAGLAALAKTAAWEWPAASVRAIDLELAGRSPTGVAAQLLHELLEGGTELEVGLRADGSRLVPSTEEAPAPAGAPALGREDVVVVSGGARGVTAACVVELARRTGARFALLGRTPLADEPEACRGVADRAELGRQLWADARSRGEQLAPRGLDARVRALLAGREVRETLAAVEAAGGSARYLAADVLDPADLARALAAVRGAWGPVTAVVHGAGINADRRILDKPEEEARAVFDTKVRGLVNLLAATSEDPLRALCGFGSISGRWGNPGQADYAMANDVAAKLLDLERRRRPALSACRSIAWGPWDGGMVTPALRVRWESAGVPVLASEEGAARLCAELAAGADEVEVVVGSEFATLADGPAPSAAAELRVSRRVHPEIGSHVVEGTPVVPVALVHEWMVRLARADALALTSVRCVDLRVLRGLRLERYDADGDLLALAAQPEVAAGECLRPGFDQRLAVTVHDAAGALRYRARIRLTRAPAPPLAPAPLTAPRPLRTPIYGPRGLFHGPLFQVVSEVAWSEAGARCTLAGALDVGWSTAPRWRTDPAVVDGALQLAGLWSSARRGGAWLPTGIGEIEVYVPGLLAGPLRATLAGRELDEDRSVSDVWVQAQDGTTVAELREVSFHRYG